MTQGSLLPPHATACSTCPWRRICQESPPTSPHAVADVTMYTDGRLWSDWNGTGLGARDGFRVSCHQGRGETGAPNPAPHWCAGGDATQHRAVLRWWESGRTDLGPLTGVDAARRIIGDLLGVDPAHIGEEFTIGGWQLTHARLLELVHPDVANPAVGYDDQVPAPTADEIDRWQREIVGL